MEANRERLIAENLELAERLLQRKLRNPTSLPDNVLIVPLNLIAGPKNPLTTARWNVLRVLRAHGRYDRIQDLADALGRGKHRVSKDVDVLASFGLVHKTKHGRETSVEADPPEILVA
jgi:DNA-binding MarR family transcriptional regulator